MSDDQERTVGLTASEMLQVLAMTRLRDATDDDRATFPGAGDALKRVGTSRLRDGRLVWLLIGSDSSDASGSSAGVRMVVVGGARGRDVEIALRPSQILSHPGQVAIEARIVR